jgi:virginiamycin B lyase
VEVTTPRARPYGIKVDVANRPWIALLGTNRLATVDPETMVLTEIELPDAGARPRRLEIDRKGAVWYVDYAGGMLGRYTPADGAFRQWPLPSGPDSRPYGTALDDRGVLWIAETGRLPNRLVGFDTAQQIFVSASPVSSGGSVRHMYFDNETKAVWFGVDSGFIVRARRAERK